MKQSNLSIIKYFLQKLNIKNLVRYRKMTIESFGLGGIILTHTFI